MKKISYDHPEYNRIRRETERVFNSTFNCISLDVVEKYYDGLLFEYIKTPSNLDKDEEHYPMWNTVFEAKDECINNLISKHVDELNEIGLGVITGKDSMNSMLFVNGAGYDFYEAHWIPLFTQLIKWVKVYDING